MDWKTGGCLCGAVTYSFDATQVIWQGHCHCKSCQKASGAPIVSWFGVKSSAWEWTKTQPNTFQSSSWATRWFCPICGGPIAYHSQKLPNEIHGLAATLDQPDWFKPEAHFFHKAALKWLHVNNSLPRFVDGGKTLDTDV